MTIITGMDTLINHHQHKNLIDPVTLPFPNLPDQLDSTTILHLSDLHVRRPSKRLNRLIDQISNLSSVDLIVFTGDIIDSERGESAGYDTLKQITNALTPHIATLGVFGNHDTTEFRNKLHDLPITWLGDNAWSPQNSQHQTTNPDLPLSVVGIDCQKENLYGDFSTALDHETQYLSNSHFRILLSHMPTWIPNAADAGINLVLAGHTHGGQCRLPGNIVLYNGSEKWPLRLSTGILRQNNTFAVISRGIGDSAIQGLRVFCPPHAPLITLKRAPQPTIQNTKLTCIKHW